MSEIAITREQWLVKATDLFRPLFERHGSKIPEKTRVTCGWPSVKALGSTSRRIGECWPVEASADGTSEIFISPYLTDVDGPQGVLATLVHEIVHAAVGCAHGHDKVFGKLARAVGLEGKLTATHAGDELVLELSRVSAILGPYPHAKLDLAKSPRKKQTTRMIKCECRECGFIVRTTRKWIEEVGAPHCPKHGEMLADLKDNDDDLPED